MNDFHRYQVSINESVPNMKQMCALPGKGKMKLWLLPAFILALLVLTGCDDTITNKDIDNVTIPSANVSFAQHIQPLLLIKCAGSGCHDDASRAGQLSVTTWGLVTASPANVFPGEPQSSRLFQVIEYPLANGSMPPLGYPQLTQNQIQGIKTWIKEGAKNN